MGLLDDDRLARSAVVANCRMNRERDLTGSNGYTREIGFSPLDVLRARIAPGRLVAWLDLCCGTGKALIQAARVSHAERIDIEIVGVDLVGMFHRLDPDLTHLASRSSVRPDHVRPRPPLRRRQARPDLPCHLLADRRRALRGEPRPEELQAR